MPRTFVLCLTAIVWSHVGLSIDIQRGLSPTYHSPLFYKRSMCLLCLKAQRQLIGDVVRSHEYRVLLVLPPTSHHCAWTVHTAEEFSRGQCGPTYGNVYRFHCGVSIKGLQLVSPKADECDAASSHRPPSAPFLPTYNSGAWALFGMILLRLLDLDPCLPHVKDAIIVCASQW